MTCLSQCMWTQRLFLSGIVSLAHRASVNRQLHCPLCAAAHMVREHPFCAALEGEARRAARYCMWVARAKTTMAKGSRRHCEDAVAWWGQLSSPCAVLCCRGRKASCLRVASGSQSKWENITAGTGLEHRHVSPPQIIDRHVLLLKNRGTTPIFSNKVRDLQAQEFLVGLDHWCRILWGKYPCYVPSAARTVTQSCSQLPRLGSQLHRGKSRVNPQDSKNKQYEAWDWKRRFREL